ncbi:PTS system, fructose-specific IIA component [Amphibacillus marinus]|uniref:PTS system, fructose-specific IIA component n=1 Tax=Amphibacillus marinus TaxID=872970 RepID=A0A1H8L9P0_9BACI|nr:PTS sugar transporter subunit IIA [Amphibacillus marinus]SEO01801.1 PTS system, fructose-specific IIA component [Amphibacillus marinus]
MILEKTVFLGETLHSKDEIFSFIAKQAYKLEIVHDEQVAVSDLKKREAEVSTGLQDGFAIPHCRTENVKKTAILFIRLDNEIKWETFDGKDVKNVFCILVPAGSENNNAIHLQLISKIAVNLLEDEFKQKIATAKSTKEIVELINFED